LSLLFKLTRLIGIPLRKIAQGPESKTPEKMKYIVDDEEFFEWIQILFQMHQGHKSHLEALDNLLLQLKQKLEMKLNQ
jgi:hypothetical protein